MTHTACQFVARSVRTVTPTGVRAVRGRPARLGSGWAATAGTVIDEYLETVDDSRPQHAIPGRLGRAGDIARRILTFRGYRVILDSDLADLYGVTTKSLNQAAKRNTGRFPEDFTFRLTAAEKEEVVTRCDHLSRLRFSPALPVAFTEHGVIMMASILNSPRAVEASVHVVRAFVRMREVLAAHRGLAERLDELEQKYDARLRVVFDAIRALMEPARPPRRRIGF